MKRFDAMNRKMRKNPTLVERAMMEKEAKDKPMKGQKGQNVIGPKSAQEMARKIMSEKKRRAPARLKA
jgi:hypothetical protein